MQWRGIVTGGRGEDCGDSTATAVVFYTIQLNSKVHNLLLSFEVGHSRPRTNGIADDVDQMVTDRKRQGQA